VTRHRLCGERGSVTVELALLTPALLMLIGLVVLAGRVVNARTDVLGAARDGARAASIEGERAADGAARGSLRSDGYQCRELNVNSQVQPAVLLPEAAPGRATVRVTCIVSLSSLGVPFPGSVTISEVAIEVVDAYRSR
jgi:Flp pilus assembly protein TadG